MTDPKPMSEVEFAYITGHFASDFRTAQNDKMAWCYGRELVAEVRRLRARERELHAIVRSTNVGLEVDSIRCHLCGVAWGGALAADYPREFHAKDCLAAPLPKEDEG